MEKNIITRAEGKRIPKKYTYASGCCLLAGELLGELASLEETFLYLYQRFGKPNNDNRDDTGLVFEYLFKITGRMYFKIGVGVRNQVYIYGYMHSSLLRQYQKAYAQMANAITREALRECILFYPALLPKTDCLTETNRKKWEALMKGKSREFFGMETSEKLESYDWEHSTLEESREMSCLLKPFYEGLHQEFWQWAEGRDDAAMLKNMTHLSLLPEAREMFKDFCKFLQKETWVGGRKIGIKGWV